MEEEKGKTCTKSNLEQHQFHLHLFQLSSYVTKNGIGDICIRQSLIYVKLFIMCVCTLTQWRKRKRKPILFIMKTHNSYAKMGKTEKIAINIYLGNKFNVKRQFLKYKLFHISYVVNDITASIYNIHNITNRSSRCTNGRSEL